MAGVVAALEADDHVGAAREPVDDLALAFVAPLGADDGDVAHVDSLLGGSPRAPRAAKASARQSGPDSLKQTEQKRASQRVLHVPLRPCQRAKRSPTGE